MKITACKETSQTFTRSNSLFLRISEIYDDLGHYFVQETVYDVLVATPYAVSIYWMAPQERC